MEDPATWWTDFWFRSHDTDSWSMANPSAAHFAIASLMKFVLWHHTLIALLDFFGHVCVVFIGVIQMCDWRLRI